MGLEINLQIALLVLGIAILIGIYLYSRFHDHGISRSTTKTSDDRLADNIPDSFISDEEYQSRQDIPNFLAGLEPAGIPKAGIGNPPSGSSHVPSEHQQQEPDAASERSENHATAQIVEVEDEACQEEPEPPVLSEQVHLEDMVESMEVEDDSRQLEQPDHQENSDVADISESPPDSHAELKPDITLDPSLVDEHVDRHGLDELVVDSSIGKTDEFAAYRIAKPKLDVLGFFNRFRKQELDSEAELEGIHDIDEEYDDIPTEADVAAVRATGEFGKHDVTGGESPKIVGGDQPPRFKYPEIPGFEQLGQIDYWVKLFGGGDVGKEALQAQYKELFGTLNKATRIYGIRTTDHQWTDVLSELDSARFVKLVISLQLVDARGPITRSELNRFTEMVTRFSESIGKDVTFMAPLESAIQQARTLSEYVKTYDSPCLVLVVPALPNQRLNGKVIANCAAQIGLETHKTNYFVRTKTLRKEKMLLYGVANLSDEGTFDFARMDTLETQGVVFFFHPVIHETPGAVLSEMVSTAISFAGRIGAKAITTDGEEFTAAMTADIRLKIESRCNEMAACGLKSGADSIMRIFESDVIVKE